VFFAIGVFFLLSATVFNAVVQLNLGGRDFWENETEFSFVRGLVWFGQFFSMDYNDRIEIMASCTTSSYRPGGKNNGAKRCMMISRST
jgi:hypothetical protein